MDERFEWISKRAYAIWEASGRPWGLSEKHWKQAVAEREIMERTRASTDGAEVLVQSAQKKAVAQRRDSSQADTRAKRQTRNGTG